LDVRYAIALRRFDLHSKPGPNINSRVRQCGAPTSHSSEPSARALAGVFSLLPGLCCFQRRGLVCRASGGATSLHLLFCRRPHPPASIMCAYNYRELCYSRLAPNTRATHTWPRDMHPAEACRVVCPRSVTPPIVLSGTCQPIIDSAHACTLRATRKAKAFQMPTYASV
jgi:hypothetical protein